MTPDIAQGEQITWEKIEYILQRADAVKLQHALERIAKAQPPEARTEP